MIRNPAVLDHMRAEGDRFALKFARWHHEPDALDAVWAELRTRVPDESQLSLVIGYAFSAIASQVLPVVLSYAADPAEATRRLELRMDRAIANIDAEIELRRTEADA